MYVFYTEIVKLFINYFMCLSSGFFCFGNLFFMCPIWHLMAQQPLSLCDIIISQIW